MISMPRRSPERPADAMWRTLSGVQGTCWKAPGSLSDIPLSTLKRKQGKAVLEALQAETVKDGKPQSVSTIERVLSILAAVTEKGLVEFDLAGVVANPFRKLNAKRPGQAPAKVVSEI